jgi:hypothetical protein
MSDEAREFMQQPEYLNGPTECLYPDSTVKRDCWWFGESSPYEQIKHLLPNHYLDLCSGHAARYWPGEKLKKCCEDVAAARIADLLIGFFHGATKRYNLALGLSAGLDSRVLLASCKQIADKTVFFTLVADHEIEISSNFDVIIPARLLKSLGYPHQIIKYECKLHKHFLDIYRMNLRYVSSATVLGLEIQGLYEHLPENFAFVSGNVSEIGRNFYGIVSNDEISVELLMEFAGNPKGQLAKKSISSWLDKCIGRCRKADIKVSDLFYWENRMGNWQAMVQLEEELVCDVLTPFNCRSILETLLSVDDKSRTKPEYSLYKKIISLTWPETLLEPINPQKIKFGSRLINKTLNKFLPGLVHWLKRRQIIPKLYMIIRRK